MVAVLLVVVVVIVIVTRGFGTRGETENSNRQEHEAIHEPTQPAHLRRFLWIYM